MLVRIWEITAQFNRWQMHWNQVAMEVVFDVFVRVQWALKSFRELQKLTTKFHMWHKSILAMSKTEFSFPQKCF